MTGGNITVLGDTGVNFGAGMTGGFAYVLDQSNRFVDRFNSELVEIQRINSEYLEASRNHLRKNIQMFIKETDSLWGRHILEHWADFVGKFWLVKPKAASVDSLLDNIKKRPE